MTVRNDHQSTSPTNLAARPIGLTLLTFRPSRSGSNTSWLVAPFFNPGSGSGGRSPLPIGPERPLLMQLGLSFACQPRMSPHLKPVFS